MLFDPGCTNCGCPPTGIACGACSVPATNLTLTIINSTLGTITTPMVFNGTTQWQSTCVSQIRYTMTCSLGLLSFMASYYVNGTCPTGQVLACSSGNSSPLSLNFSINQCSPLLLRWTTAGGCPALSSLGYSSFTVTV